MQLLIVKLGELCWIWFEKCTGLRKLLSLYSTDCSYTSGISMKKHSGSLVSKPGEKNNIYQQHHTEFTALEIGRKTQIHKVSLDRWTHHCNSGWVFRGPSGRFMRLTISIQCVCLDTYALWINISHTDSTVSFTSIIKINSKAQNGD